MALVTATQIIKSVGGVPLLAGVSLSLEPGEKVGLVGRNGAGKSTLLRILAGREEADGGTVWVRPGARVGYLPQLPEGDGQRTVWAEALLAFSRVRTLEGRLAALEARLSEREVQAESGLLHEVLEEYGRVREEYERSGGFTYEASARRALRGLGFREDQFSMRLVTLSGGQRSRATLARLLLEAPDLLLLDEPTNHLDLDALEWLQETLAQYRGAVLLSSHDRALLDAVTTRTLELDKGRLEDYPGPYSFFVVERESRRARQQEAFKRHQAEVASLRAFIDRYRAGQRSRQAKSREKRLAKLPRIEPPRTARTLSFQLEAPRRAPSTVVRVRGLSKAFGSQVVLQDVTFEVRRGDRVALIGPNGAGKTTLLRILGGLDAPSRGLVEVTPGVRIGYFAQDSDETLDPTRTVLEEALGTRPLQPDRVRTVLGRFLFSGEDALKKVGQLSGGERQRLALVKLVLDRPDLLLLDEPTTHLDLPSVEAVEEALLAYPGALVLVSHDRALVDCVAHRLLVLTDGRLEEFQGPYHRYRDAQATGDGDDGPAEIRPRPPVSGSVPSSPPRARKSGPSPKAGTAVDDLVDRITRLEEEQAHLGRLMGDPELYRDAARARETIGRYEEVSRALEALYLELAEAEEQARA